MQNQRSLDRKSATTNRRPADTDRKPPTRLMRCGRHFYVVDRPKSTDAS
ncbi:MAG: hypothetical protein AAGF97_10735 [Planctomycetota bacterium]